MILALSFAITLMNSTMIIIADAKSDISRMFLKSGATVFMIYPLFISMPPKDVFDLIKLLIANTLVFSKDLRPIAVDDHYNTV